MTRRAWVTLATNDSYGLGALVLAHSLRRVGSTYPCAVLITPSVTDSMRERLRTVYSEVALVDVLDSGDSAHLALLRRPELGITFTKLHCWNLTHYEKCVFLDADTLVMQNCDELFGREELSAAPDVGWPDCFNSGVFVFRPSKETFDKLLTFANDHGSFDGGDQGLLNSFFSNWAQEDISKHLPFIYNVTSAAFYSYLPALQHYGSDAKIIHFIGSTKPWLVPYDWTSGVVDAPDHLKETLQLWWNLFVTNVHPSLDTNMTGVAGSLARITPCSVAQKQSDAFSELTRRQGWETGNIDYMGADSFNNIWAKISDTLSKPPKITHEELITKNDDSATGVTSSQYKQIDQSREINVEKALEDLQIADTKKDSFKDSLLPVVTEVIKSNEENVTDHEKLLKNTLPTEKTVLEFSQTNLEGNSPNQILTTSDSSNRKLYQEDIKQMRSDTKEGIAESCSKGAIKVGEDDLISKIDSAEYSDNQAKTTTKDSIDNLSTLTADSEQSGNVNIEPNLDLQSLNVNVKTEVSSEEAQDTSKASGFSTDSPPLANTSIKEDVAIIPEVKYPKRACYLM